MKAGEKQYLTHKGKTIRMTANFTSETTKAKRKRHDIFQVLKGENCQTGIQQKYPAAVKRKSRHSQIKICHKTYLKRMAKRSSLKKKETNKKSWHIRKKEHEKQKYG